MVLSHNQDKLVRLSLELYWNDQTLHFWLKKTKKKQQITPEYGPKVKQF